jgi:hypothetical protein
MRTGSCQIIVRIWFLITFSGQDTSEIIPEAVSTDKDIVADEFGYSVDEEEEWQGIAE